MEHEVDENGEVVHVDIDQQIPTGICAACASEKEDETHAPTEA